MVSGLVPFLCAVGAGILSGWGVGGGTLLLLVMTLFLGVEQQAAQGINLLFFLPTAAAALLRHRKEGLLDLPLLHTAIPPAVIAALAGSVLAAVTDTELLRRPFGIYLLLCGWAMLRQKKNTGE